MVTLQEQMLAKHPKFSREYWGVAFKGCYACRAAKEAAKKIVMAHDLCGVNDAFNIANIIQKEIDATI